MFYNKCPFGVLHSHFTSVVQRHLNLTNLKHVWTMSFEGLCVKEEISRITSIYVGIIYIAVFVGLNFGLSLDFFCKVFTKLKWKGKEIE